MSAVDVAAQPVVPLSSEFVQHVEVDSTSSSPPSIPSAQNEHSSAVLATSPEAVNASNANGNSTEANLDSFTVQISVPGGESFEQEVSSMELVQDIHQILMDRESSCHRTCFSLHLNGQVLDNFAEIKSVAGIKEGVTITVVEENYNLREAKNHVKHVQDLLRSLDPVDAYQGRDMMSLSFMNTIISNSIAAYAKCRDEREAVMMGASIGLDAFDALLPSTSSSGVNQQHENSSTALSLSSLFPVFKEAQPARCLQALDYSVWNPPPPNRRLQGDLLYLTVLTLGNKRFHVTACPRGFYLNQSSEEVFNPRPSISGGQQTACFSHSLVDLLKQLCPVFRRNFDQLLKLRNQKHPLERIPCPYQVYSWIVPLQEHSIEHCKREESFCSKMAYEENLPGQTREWNEELQTSRELPRSNLMERIVRQRAVFKSYSDFVAAATRAAQAVINGNIMPINPGEDLRQQMFIWNNMFFSLGFDVKDHYKEYGGDAAAYTATALDLNGIAAVMNLDLDDLYTLGTAIIDFRGYRVTAQTIIPGILEKEQEQSVVYGSIDFGKTIVTNEKYAELLEKCSSLLKILPHRLLDSNGEAKELQSSVECKGIVGNDHRHYVLDLLRFTPPDINFMPLYENADLLPLDDEQQENGDSAASTGKQFPRLHPHRMPVVRHELLEIFTECRYITFLRLAARQLQLMKKADGSKPADKTVDKIESSGASEVAESEEEVEAVKQILTSSASNGSETDSMEATTVEIIKKAADAVGSLSSSKFHIAFNPDVYQSNIRFPPDDRDLVRRDMRLVKELCDYITQVQIPRFIIDCVELRLVPADSQGLVEALHQNGINLRYLGFLLDGLRQHPSIQYLTNMTVNEIVVRAAKHRFKQLLQTVDVMNVASVVAHFLNCLVGSCPQPHTQISNEEVLKISKRRGRAKKTKTSKDNQQSEHQLTHPWLATIPSQLWSQIVAEIRAYFHVEIGGCADVDQFVHEFSWPRLCLLRCFCQAVGIQIALRDYPLELRSRAVFAGDDIVMLFPRVKHLKPQASDAQTLFSTGQSRISQGAFNEANWMLTEALNLFNQIYGPLNMDSANCNRLLGRLAYVKNDFQAAVMYQQRALLISERVLGIDSALAGQEYAHLALYYFSLNQFAPALHLMYRSRYIALLNHGDIHPEIAMIDTNIGLMLHAVEDFDKSLIFLQNALRLNSKFFGATSLKVALSSHLVARTFSCRGDFRQALTMEKESYAIYKLKLGDSNERTVESNECLKHLTEQAVEFAKRMQDMNRFTSSSSTTNNNSTGNSAASKLHSSLTGSQSNAGTPSGQVSSQSAATFLPAFHVQRPSLSNLVDTLNLVNGIFVIQLSAEDVESLQREMSAAKLAAESTAAGEKPV